MTLLKSDAAQVWVTDREEPEATTSTGGHGTVFDFIRRNLDRNIEDADLRGRAQITVR